MIKEYYPKISVAMACYNVEKYVKAAIKSIIRQKYDNWEIIFVEDCSTDDTLVRIEKYIKEYELEGRSKLAKHSYNMGYGTALHDAIKYGKGELVAVIDADDALASKYAFTKMVQAHMQNPTASLCYSTYYFCRNKLSDRWIKDVEPLPDGMTYLDALLKSIGKRKNGKPKYPRISHFKVFKRSFYDKTEKLKKGLRKSVDRDLVLKLEEVGGLVFVPYPLYYHRKHDGNITNMWGKLSKAEQHMIMVDRAGIIHSAKVRRGLVK
jgi:glycosyltransferase involved in cell wall biosynthesis